MSQVLSDYFVREAGEYLAELERLLARDEVPDAERMFRLARGIRGSAQVAQADGIAEVAARLEGAARFILEGRIPWSGEIRERVLRTTGDLEALLPRVGRGWSGREDARVQDAIARWGGFAEVANTPAAAARGDPVFSFVRTELDGVIEVLDRALPRLRSAPADPAPLDELLRRIRTVRGVAGSGPLAPVLEVLEALDELARALAASDVAASEEALEVLGAARDALDRASARLEQGAGPAVDDPALERFHAARAQLGMRLAPDADDVVPIRKLFYDDADPHVVSSPVAPVLASGESDPPARVLEFLQVEATALLDRADALVGEVAQRDGFESVAGRLVDLASAVGELAGTYGLTHLALAATYAADRLARAPGASQARAVLAELRGALEPAHGGRTRGGDADVLPIEDLLLSGERALEEALVLRRELEELLSERQVDQLREKLDELFDLVQLARSDHG